MLPPARVALAVRQMTLRKTHLLILIFFFPWEKVTLGIRAIFAAQKVFFPWLSLPASGQWHISLKCWEMKTLLCYMLCVCTNTVNNKPKHPSKNKCSRSPPDYVQLNIWLNFLTELCLPAELTACIGTSETKLSIQSYGT